MSRQNKVNKDSYVQAGRLTPDDIARERRRQAPKQNIKAPARPVRGGQPRGERGASRPRSAPEE
jgi:hypothetical protein